MSDSSIGMDGPERLKTAFISLLLKYEYSKITIKSLTTEAGMNRTSFYLFYESKDELAQDTCSSFLAEYSQMMTESFSLHPDKKTEKLIQHAFQYIDSKKSVILGLWSIKEVTFSPYLIMQQTIEDDIYRALKKSEKNFSDATVDFYSKLYAANAITTVKWWLENREDFSYSFITKAIIDCCVKGMNSLLI